MNYTLNQIAAKLRTFATSHGQIKGNYSFGELEEVSNQGVLNFPYMFCILKPGLLGSQNVEINISIIVMDLVNKDLSNRMEVWSDTLQILTDLRAYLDDPSFDDLFTIDIQNIPTTPFADRFTDDVTGWVADLKFRIVDLKDRCAIPQ